MFLIFQTSGKKYSRKELDWTGFLELKMIEAESLNVEQSWEKNKKINLVNTRHQIWSVCITFFGTSVVTWSGHREIMKTTFSGKNLFLRPREFIGKYLLFSVHTDIFIVDCVVNKFSDDWVGDVGVDSWESTVARQEAVPH